MATWMFFCPPLFGHTNPTLPLVAEMVRRGERVVYYNAASFREAIEPTGAEFRAYHRDLPSLPAAMSVRQIELVPPLVEATELFLDTELQRILADPPDFVVHDYVAFWGAAVSDVTGAPRLGTTPGLMLNENVSKLAKSIVPPELLPGGAGVRWSDIPLLLSVIRRRFRTNRKYGLKYRWLKDLSHAEFNIAFTSPEIQPHADEFADRFCFVGPPELRQEDDSGFDFESLTGAPLVYISLGTLFNDRPEFFESCYEALGGLDVQVVLSLGGRNTELPAPPKNFILGRFPPQLTLLGRAAAFLTHSGISSVCEAVQIGVPLVLYPQIWDQYLMAHQAELAGAGVSLPRDPTPAQIREKVTAVLSDPSYRTNSRELGRRLAAAGGARRAADELMKWAESARGSSSPSGARMQLA
ncbi:MAG: hypothetical protein GC160_29090 [Acidobacteria bacterium]|nr:hypothetical protein [Acidobacteriota bacterium]